MAAAESPPPTTPSPLTFVSASATVFVPAANGASSNTPIGPFQNTVVELAMSSANRAAVSGPMSRPSPSSPNSVSSMASMRATVCGGVRREGACDDHVGRQHQLDSAVRGLGDVAARLGDTVRVEQALADRVALRLEEGEQHAAADQQPVDLGQQRVDDAELVADLRPAEDDRVRLRRVRREALEHVELGRDQQAGGARQRHRQLVDARVARCTTPKPSDTTTSPSRASSPAND